MKNQIAMTMPLCPFLGTMSKTQFPSTHMSSNSIDTPLVPSKLSGNFWEFFWVVQGLCHFIEHLAHPQFSENFVLQSVEFLSMASLVVLVLSL